MCQHGDTGGLGAGCLMAGPGVGTGGLFGVPGG
jgi:hypothetical protein